MGELSIKKKFFEFSDCLLAKNLNSKKKKTHENVITSFKNYAGVAICTVVKLLGAPVSSNSAWVQVLTCLQFQLSTNAHLKGSRYLGSCHSWKTWTEFPASNLALGVPVIWRMNHLSVYLCVGVGVVCLSNK